MAVKSKIPPQTIVLGTRTSVVMHDATVQQPLTTMSPNSNSTIVMLQPEAGFVSKQNVVPFRGPCPPFIALVVSAPVVSSQE
ncbi:hypothetical protein TNCV_5085561 [Trichonephila clavipes]|uniref:Uncharacterized protein n=1 Tax=Trichonephila clavipes TaxID=2585209 RepID=A0A8X6SF92_TRICX|nr:hypothetical protein TNCV_5085561 [Trichonephila clavipes]